MDPTEVSVGRGTSTQFQIYGHPDFPDKGFSFTPQSNFGSKNPKHKGQVCYGKDLTQVDKPDRIELQWLINAYSQFPNKESFFLKGFERIAGVSSLKTQLETGESEASIRNSWTADLESFKKIRVKYLLYP